MIPLTFTHVKYFCIYRKLTCRFPAPTSLAKQMTGSVNPCLIQHSLNKWNESVEIILFPNTIGYKTVDGYLLSQGVRVQRQRVRDSLYRLEPERQELRRVSAVHRRHYSVESPLSLWHIDGHHKLIRLVSL